MKPIVPVLGVALVLGMAVWAYQQNYATKDALARVDTLNRDISVQRERLAILRAEWAYLNRPERLRDLVDMNFDRLRLLPMTHASFRGAKELPYPEYERAASLPLRDGNQGVSQ